MTAPAAIQGSYTDLKLIRGRKVAIICIEIPIEQAEQFVAAFGIPNGEAETWVALARLDLTANGKPNDNWKPDAINIASHCALVCQKPTFWEYIRKSRHHPCNNEEDAATFVRRFCNVNTRADLATNEKARLRWQFLESAYEDSMNSGGAA